MYHAIFTLLCSILLNYLHNCTLLCVNAYLLSTCTSTNTLALALEQWLIAEKTKGQFRLTSNYLCVTSRNREQINVTESHQGIWTRPIFASVVSNLVLVASFT